MYSLVCSITSIESLAGFRVLFDYVGARGVFSSINETFSLKRIRTLARAVENLVVNSRIPPPFANRLSGASGNSAGDGRSSPAPSLCGPQSSRYIHHVDPRRACGVAPALQSTPTKSPLLPLL